MGVFNPPPPPYPVDQLFLQVIAGHAGRYGEKPALLWQGGELSWRQLEAWSNQVARALLAAGAAKGQRAAIVGIGTVDYVVVFLGILKAGLSVVPLSTMSTPQLVTALLEDSAARFLFADRRSLEKFGDDVLRGKGLLIGLDFATEGSPSLAQWHENYPDTRPDVDFDGGDEFNVIYSSGTTGTPKGIVHDHRFRSTQVQGFQLLGLSAESLTVLTTALYTNYSLLALLATLGAGGAVYLLPRFGEEEFLALCRDRNITHAFLVPVQINRLLDHPDFNRSLTGGSMVVVSAGSPLPVARKREILARWPGMLLEIYGATEGGGVTLLIANQYPDKLASVGKPSEGNDIRIISEQGEELPVGEAGEIVGRSHLMMSGYLNRDQASRELIWQSPQGEIFIRSGDIGYFDADGFLYLSDRKKDVIISGGINVYASDIEAVLRRHPAVAECAVVAAPSYRRGEAPVAFVIPAQTVDAEELLQWLNQQLARHQYVKQIIFRNSLPRNAMGKVVKKDLRQKLPYAS